MTRNEPQASAFARDIQARGGVPIIAPLIRIACTYDREKIKTLQTYEWMIFTSANGVRCFHKALQENDAGDVMKRTRIATVGSKTAAALHVFGRQADFIPSVYDGKTMAPEFIASQQPTGEVLIVHGRLSGTVIQDTFQAEGISFDCLEVYATMQNEEEAPRLQEIMQTENVDIITFMSPSTAREQGFRNVYVPEVFTAEGMLTCMEQLIEKRGRG